MPAFIYRWLRDTSGKSHLRSGQMPNQRIQDGHKRYWLCCACEQLFSASETRFASNLFYPYTKDATKPIGYGPWLLHFCVSVSWRVLQFFKDETSLEGYDPDGLEATAKADQAWKEYLLGQSPHPGRFEQHLLPLGAIESSSAGTDSLPPNINRYLMRMVDKGLCRGSDGSIFVYSKLPRILVVGFVHGGRKNQWNRTKVHVRNGSIEPGTEYRIPGVLFQFIMERAKQAAQMMGSVSARQLQKIDASFEKNIEDFVGSDEFIAMQTDVEMFGDVAFTRKCQTPSAPEDGANL
ncbi:hypothetical protein [Nitrospira sp. Nam74]